MIQLTVGPPPYVLMMVAAIVMIVIMTGMVAWMARMYKKTPPGKVMVIKKMARTDVTKSGSVVVPVVHSFSFVHCEVEEIELKAEDGSTESLFVCLDDDPGAAILAMDKLGEKPVDEIRRLIARMLKKSDDHEVTLAEIGYKIVV